MARRGRPPKNQGGVGNMSIVLPGSSGGRENVNPSTAKGLDLTSEKETHSTGDVGVTTVDNTETDHTLKVGGASDLRKESEEQARRKDVDEEFPQLGNKEKLTGSEEVRTKSYASLFKSNRDIKDAVKLMFHEDMAKGKLKVTTEDMEISQVEWKSTLIGVVTGGYANLRAMETFARDNWPGKCQSMHQRDNGVYVFKFAKEADRDWVLEKGPWYLEGTKPILLQEWSPGNPIDWEVFGAIPTWVCFPNIDPSLVSVHMLSKLGSAVGKPVCLDEYTASGRQVSYARVLIEVSAEETAIKEVVIERPDGTTTMQKVVFEWLPPSCQECKQFGHAHSTCPQRKWVARTNYAPARQMRKQWVPKNSVNAVKRKENKAPEKRTELGPETSKAAENRGKHKEVANGKSDVAASDTSRDKNEATVNGDDHTVEKQNQKQWDTVSGKKAAKIIILPRGTQLEQVNSSNGFSALAEIAEGEREEHRGDDMGHPKDANR